MSVRDRVKNLERRSSTSSPAPRASESSISQAELDAIRAMKRETEPEEVRRASMPSRPDWLDAALEAPQEEKKSSGSVSSLAARFKQLPVFGMGKPPGPKLPKVDESTSASQPSESKPSVSVDTAASASSPAKPQGVPVSKLASPIATAGKPTPSSPPVVPPPTGNEDRPTVPSGMKRQPSYKNLTGKTDVKNKIKHLGAVLPVFGQPMPPRRSSMVEVSSSQLVSTPADRSSESAVTSERLSESDARMTRTTVNHTRRAPRKKRPIGDLGPVAAAITPIEPIPEKEAAKEEEKTEEKEDREEVKQETTEAESQEDKQKEEGEVKAVDAPKSKPDSPVKSQKDAPENEANGANEAPETKAEATQPEDELEVARPDEEKKVEQPGEVAPDRSEEPAKESAAGTLNAAEPEITNGESGTKPDAAPEDATTEPEADDA